MILQHREDFTILPSRVLIGRRAARELTRSGRRLGLSMKKPKPGCIGMVNSVFVEYVTRLDPDDIKLLP